MEQIFEFSSNSNAARLKYRSLPVNLTAWCLCVVENKGFFEL